MTDIIRPLSDIGARWVRLASTLCAPPYLSSMLAGLDTLFSDPVIELAEICQQLLERSNLVESETAARDESTSRSASSHGQTPRAGRLVQSQRAPFLAMPGFRSPAGSAARAATPRTTALSAEFNEDAHRALKAVTLPPHQSAQHPLNFFASQFTPLSEQEWQALHTENRSRLESAPDTPRESEPASTQLADRQVGRPSNQSTRDRMQKSTPNRVTAWDTQATQFEPPASVRMAHDPLRISAVLQANLASAPFAPAPIPADEFMVSASEGNGESNLLQMSADQPLARVMPLVDEFDPDVNSAPTLNDGLDWERFVEKLAEHLELEFLRTYGTSGG